LCFFNKKKKKKIKREGEEMGRGGRRVRTKRWKANGKTNELFLLSGSGLIRTTLPFRLISFLSGEGEGGDIIEG
jgi:hypothetical protein